MAHRHCGRHVRQLWQPLDPRTGKEEERANAGPGSAARSPGSQSGWDFKDPELGRPPHRIPGLSQRVGIAAQSE